MQGKLEDFFAFPRWANESRNDNSRDARPHPNLLPRGEGTAFAPLWFADYCPANPVAGFRVRRFRRNPARRAGIRLVTPKADEGGRRGEESQRDFVMQPRVVRNELPWVDDERIQKPQRGFVNVATREGHNPVGVENDFMGRFTQGSSFLATAGLRAGIPLGFCNGTHVADLSPQPVSPKSDSARWNQTCPAEIR